MADDLCIVRSIKTEQINHDPAHYVYEHRDTDLRAAEHGSSWLQYGLGSEADDLPGFVVLTSVGGGQNQPIAARQWHSGFLPSRFQGVQFHCELVTRCCTSTDRRGVTRSMSSASVVDAVNQLNRLRGEAVDDPEISTRIAQYEMAFKMQTSVPELTDLSGEPQARSGGDTERKGADGSFASNCLLGSATGRAGRAVHPVLPSRLGPPRERQRGCRQYRQSSSIREPLR